jgi:hypothetical protein
MNYSTLTDVIHQALRKAELMLAGESNPDAIPDLKKMVALLDVIERALRIKALLR